VYKGACIATGVTVVGTCEQRKEKGVCGGVGYIIGVSAE
jgi:hypothetical protein